MPCAIDNHNTSRPSFLWWNRSAGSRHWHHPRDDLKNKNMFNVSNIDWVCEPSVCALMKQHLTSRITWCRDGVPVHPAVALSKPSGKYMSTAKNTNKYYTRHSSQRGQGLKVTSARDQSTSQRNNAPLGRVRLPHKYTNEVSFAIVSAFCVACCLSSGYTQKTYDFHTIRPLPYQSCSNSHTRNTIFQWPREPTINVMSNTVLKFADLTPPASPRQCSRSVNMLSQDVFC